jgi:hypothetical protein
MHQQKETRNYRRPRSETVIILTCERINGAEMCAKMWRSEAMFGLQIFSIFLFQATTIGQLSACIQPRRTTDVFRVATRLN